MRVCSICAAAAFVLGVVGGDFCVAVSLEPVVRVLSRYNAGYSSYDNDEGYNGYGGYGGNNGGNGGYGGGYGGYGGGTTYATWGQPAYGLRPL